MRISGFAWRDNTIAICFRVRALVKAGCSREIANITRDSVKRLLCRMLRSSLPKLQGLASVRRSQYRGTDLRFVRFNFQLFRHFPWNG
jgi:hypothetical protein